MKISNEKYSTHKLELYLEKSTRGFILITVNKNLYKKDLIRLICSYEGTVEYDLQEIEFSDTINEIKSNRSNKRVLYHNFENSNLENVLEKINLSRDLLLSQDKLYVFVVPQYINKIIQQDYPNLYSYCVLKEDYVEKCEGEYIFEYIIPGFSYLNTKESQRISKGIFQLNRGSLNERLDYYMRSKAKQEELQSLEYDVRCVVERISENMEKYDWKYQKNLLFKLAKVLSAQQEYDEALRVYETILANMDLEHCFLGIYYESVLGIGDVYLMKNDYGKAMEIYKRILMWIIKEDREEHAQSIDSTLTDIYHRIALCYIGQEEFELSYQYMNSSLDHMQGNDALNNQDFFGILYNYLLLVIQMDLSEVYNNRMIPQLLEREVKNTVQQAMYYTLYAWLLGIVEGELQYALQLAHRALEIKREHFIENDLRIAESHYVISSLYVMSGDYEKAELCCRKSLNILKNFENKSRQNDFTKKLLTKISHERTLMEKLKM